ncbi:hypothetical protein [Thiocapsa bogorovii]|uniref:hypothetical protein n=1 Tax=Thiocapsa bogorovii TaxID=521689 RepID=UPI001E4E456A|nr:hypothetical protein [Thiocapsa bogorovii]UHD18229.1 hypothetical protein LT988_09440 [Thiocapsa bogorovii]
MTKHPAGHQAPQDPDAGVIVALLKRLRTQRLPRLLDIKAKVERGARLDSFDIAFLTEVFTDATAMQSKWAQHPELDEIVAKMVHLYHEITERALNNESDDSDATPNPNPQGPHP